MDKKVKLTDAFCQFLPCGIGFFESRTSASISFRIGKGITRELEVYLFYEIPLIGHHGFILDGTQIGYCPTVCSRIIRLVFAALGFFTLG